MFFLDRERGRERERRQRGRRLLACAGRTEDERRDGDIWERGGGGAGGGGRGPCGGGQDEEDAVLDGELVGLLAEAIKGLKGIFLGRKRVKPLAGIYMGPQ